jgi:uncharacterized membrane protein (DUF2068 family)
VKEKLYMQSPSPSLRLIGIFKLAKAAALLALGLGTLALLHRDAAQVVTGWISALKVGPADRWATALLSHLQLVDHRRLEEISAGTFVYAGLFATEGIGLILGKTWAEYLTVVATGLLIPLELYELAERPSPAKLGVIALNLAIVGYLISRLRTAPG